MVQLLNWQPVFELFSSVYLLEPSQSAALSLAVRALQFYKFRPNRMIFQKNRDNNFPLVHHNILLWVARETLDAVLSTFAELRDSKNAIDWRINHLKIILKLFCNVYLLKF